MLEHAVQRLSKLLFKKTLVSISIYGPFGHYSKVIYDDQALTKTRRLIQELQDNIKPDLSGYSSPPREYVGLTRWTGFLRDKH